MADFTDAPPPSGAPILNPPAAAARRVTSHKKLQPIITITDNPSEVFVVRWSPDSKYLAAGSGDGSIKVFNTQTGHVAFDLQSGSAAALPATSIRFRPSNDSTRTKNVLVSTNAVGAVQHWHVTSGKCLHTIEERDNQIYALDYRPDGIEFATGGKDATIRLYDESTKTQTHAMKGGRGYAPNASSGHSNRIFAIKYHPSDENIVVSGGWDNTVQIWDKRTGHSVRSFYGPHLCGDGLDMTVDGAGNATILTASWRPENPLELWDFATGNIIEQVEWKESLLASQPCLLYSGQFSKAGPLSKPARYIAAGGSGANEARILDRFAGEPNNPTTALVGTVAGLARGVFTIDWSPTADRVAIGSGDGTIRFLDLVQRSAEEVVGDSVARGMVIDASTEQEAQEVRQGGETAE